MKTLEVTVTPEDFRDAPNGYLAGVGAQGCVLQQALRRMFPEEYVVVGHMTATIGKGIDQKVYSINQQDWGKGEIPGGFSADAINEYSKRAKISLDDIPSKTLYLQAHETLGLHSDDLSSAIVTRLGNL